MAEGAQGMSAGTVYLDVIPRLVTEGLSEQAQQLGQQLGQQVGAGMSEKMAAQTTATAGVAQATQNIQQATAAVSGARFPNDEASRFRLQLSDALKRGGPGQGGVASALEYVRQRQTKNDQDIQNEREALAGFRAAVKDPTLSGKMRIEAANRIDPTRLAIQTHEGFGRKLEELENNYERSLRMGTEPADPFFEKGAGSAVAREKSEFKVEDREAQRLARQDRLADAGYLRAQRARETDEERKDRLATRGYERARTQQDRESVREDVSVNRAVTKNVTETAKLGGVDEQIALADQRLLAAKVGSAEHISLATEREKLMQRKAEDVDGERIRTTKARITENSKAMSFAKRLDVAEFKAQIAPLSPSRQREALEARAAEEIDPMQRAALMRDAGKLAPKTGWNRQVMSTGMFMNALFGGMEVAHAVAGLRASQAEATAAPDQMSALNARVQGIQKVTGGFLGSFAGMAMDFVGMPNSPGSIHESAAMQSAIIREQKQSRDMLIGAGEQDRLRNVPLMGPAGKFAANAVKRERERRATTDEVGEVKSLIAGQEAGAERFQRDTPAGREVQIGMSGEERTVMLARQTRLKLLEGMPKQIDADARADEAELRKSLETQARRDEAGIGHSLDIATGAHPTTVRRRDAVRRQSVEMAEAGEELAAVNSEVQRQRDAGQTPSKDIVAAQGFAGRRVGRVKRAAAAENAAIAEEQGQENERVRYTSAAGILSSRDRAARRPLEAGIRERITESSVAISQAPPEQRPILRELARQQLGEFVTGAVRDTGNQLGQQGFSLQATQAIIARRPERAEQIQLAAQQQRRMDELPHGILGAPLRAAAGLQNAAERQLLGQQQGDSKLVRRMGLDTQLAQSAMLAAATPTGGKREEMMRGAEIEGIVGGFRQQAVRAFQDGKPEDAKTILETGRNAVDAYKNDYLAGFRGDTSIDARRVDFSQNNVASPEMALAAVHAAKGRLSDKAVENLAKDGPAAEAAEEAEKVAVRKRAAEFAAKPEKEQKFAVDISPPVRLQRADMEYSRRRVGESRAAWEKRHAADTDAYKTAYDAELRRREAGGMAYGPDGKLPEPVKPASASKYSLSDAFGSLGKLVTAVTPSSLGTSSLGSMLASAFGKDADKKNAAGAAAGAVAGAAVDNASLKKLAEIAEKQLPVLTQIRDALKGQFTVGP